MLKTFWPAFAATAARVPLVGVLLIGAIAAGGCVTYQQPADGGRIQRLEPGSTPATPAASATTATRPELTAEERKRYDDIDRQVLAEQKAAQAQEERDARYRAAPPAWYGSYYGSYYGPGWGPGWWGPGWVWVGHGWRWRPRWGVGVTIWP